MSIAKLYEKYTQTNEFDLSLVEYPDDTTSLKALGEFITQRESNAGFVIDYMKNLRDAAEGDDIAIALKFMELSEDKAVARVFKDETVIREAVINHYCSVMANFIVFSTAQRKNLKDTASYNRHIDKALPEMRDSLMILFELGAMEGEYINSLGKYFEFTYYVNTPDSWKLFNSLYVYEDFCKYVNSIKEQFLGIYLRSALLPESIKKFVSGGDEGFTNAFITALSELASENAASARKTYHFAITVEGDENFVAETINLYDTMNYKAAIKSFKDNGGKFHLEALKQAKDYYEYEESPRAKEF